MSVELLRFLAMIFGPSITAAARPAVTFFVIQATVAALAFYDLVSVPSGFAWLVSIPAIIIAGVLAGLETAAKHDPDIAAVLRDLHIDTVTGAFAAFSVALLFASLGLPVEDSSALVDSAAASAGAGGNLLDATAQAVSADHSTPVQVAAVGGALGTNVGLTLLRSNLLEFVDDFDLGKVWARIETGGVVGLLVLLPFIPLIALAFLVLFAVMLVMLAIVTRTTRNYLDRLNRTECESCDYRVREEASVCPECGTERIPTMKHETGWSAAIDAIKHRRHDDATAAT